LLRRSPSYSGGTGQIPPAAVPAPGKAVAESASLPAGSFPEMPGPDCAALRCAGGGAPHRSAGQWIRKTRAPAASATRLPDAPAGAQGSIQACAGMWTTWDGNIAGKIIQIGVTLQAVMASNLIAAPWSPSQMVSITTLKS